MIIKSEQRGKSASQNRFLLINKTSDDVERKAKQGTSPLQWSLFQKTSSGAGFTLLEVLISMVILSIALLGLAALATTTIRSNTFSNDYTTASSLAQDKLEELYNNTFAGLPVGAGADGGTGTIDAEGNDPGKYTRTWTIANIVAGSTKSIAVTVTWTSSYGNAKNVVITSIKSNT